VGLTQAGKVVAFDSKRRKSPPPGARTQLLKQGNLHLRFAC
jgi:hypothetical protein